MLVLMDANGEDAEAGNRQRYNGMINKLEKQTAVPGSLCKAETTQAKAVSCGEEAG